ncbi:hypothetical protein [Catenulispora pinisilvae]|uniref:hypothetical protein n=1 Tax=Catenulispora pinisilvae TaxID=2705253 RepID=UPI001890BD76|nr:hypothetical protein [Catenulispora pinisilvae]
MDNHEEAQAAEQEQRTTALKKSIADVDARRARQIRALELAEDGDQALARDIQARVAELSTERSALGAKLTQLNETRRPLTDPTLIRGLPIGTIDLGTMNGNRRRKLFEMFRLKISYDKSKNRADCTVTIMPDTLPGLQKLLTATEFEVPLTSGVNNARMDTIEENASSVPIWKVPPEGNAADPPTPDLRKQGGRIRLVGHCCAD